MASKKTFPLQHWLALFATVFVVGGLLAVVLMRPGDEEALQDPSTASDAALRGRVIVFADHGAFHVVTPEGVELRECALDPAARLFEVTAQGVVIGFSSGDRVRVGFDCVASPTEAAVRMEEPDADAVMHMVFEGGTRVALVAQNDRPFREAQVVGWMDASHVAVVAFRGDVRYALAVSVDGALQELGALPELVGDFAAGGGAFWYVTATPGLGIEFGPRGPSALHRIALDGGEAVVARHVTDVLEGLSVSVDGAYAYRVGGTLFVGRDETSVNAGTGIPIGWSDDDRVLVVDAQQSLSFKTVDGAVIETGIVLPRGVSEAWSVALDVVSGTE